jgi:hypothetical protein
MGAKIQDRIKAQGAEINQFGASLGAGAKFDSHIVESLEGNYTGEEKDDTATFMNFSSYWQHNLNNRFGVRTDYNLYADFFHHFDEYDVIDQLASIEPQWFHNDLILSLPL